MAQMPLDVASLRAQAKSNAARNDTQLAEEQNKLAVQAGYKNWSLLVADQKKIAKHATADRLLEDVFLQFGTAETPLPTGSIQLLLSRDTTKLPRPWRAWLTDIGPDGRYRFYSNVLVDFYHQGGPFSEEIESSLSKAVTAEAVVQIPRHWPLVVWFDRDDDYDHFASLGCWQAERILRSVTDLNYARATGYKPAWFDRQAHNDLFAHPEDLGGYLSDELEYAYSVFNAGWFRRGSDCQRLAERLQRIKPGKDHSTLFQQWVADSLVALFGKSLPRVELNPNSSNPNRRDIVARNGGNGSFFARLLNDYRARMIVFEAKNYARPKAADFRQVRAYLNASHYGSVGFLVTHSPSADVDETSWVQTRSIYNGEGARKLVFVLPSAYLVELLNTQWNKRPDVADDAMEAWFEDGLLKHLQT